MSGDASEVLPAGLGLEHAEAEAAAAAMVTEAAEAPTADSESVATGDSGLAARHGPETDTKSDSEPEPANR